MKDFIEDQPRLVALVLILAEVAVLVLLVTQVPVDWPALGRWLRLHPLFLGKLAALVAAAAITVRLWWRLLSRALSRYRARRTPRPVGVSWTVVAGAALVVGGVAWGATTLLLGEADRARDPGAARVEAIKTGLGSAAGATGIFALLLAVRRQTHQELTAADVTFDATEKRVTELYAKAVEQLGSPKASVRLGGLYALDRLGQDNESQRETILNMFCAYLRMQYSPPDKLSEGATPEEHERHEARSQELQVRRTALRLLCLHRPSDAYLRLDGLRPWPGDIALDLNAAFLPGANLSMMNLKGASLAGANLRGANLRRADLSLARLTGAMLEGADLEGAIVGNANLAGVRAARASFRGVRFTGTNLTNADLSDIDFQGAYLTRAALTAARIDPAATNSMSRRF
ncbi:pentapeptide repeat-containing protein [Amycolatopsis sp. NPDC051102]|uniref:pentapeptide repeat-containing protein n=1 Tax=Amycolatopsis sp. NPDC051102 TaxID=3155163 RepID=UPI0034473804